MGSKDTGTEQYALDPADYYLEKVDDSIHDILCPVNYFVVHVLVRNLHNVRFLKSYFNKENICYTALLVY